MAIIRNFLHRPHSSGNSMCFPQKRTRANRLPNKSVIMHGSSVFCTQPKGALVKILLFLFTLVTSINAFQASAFANYEDQPLVKCEVNATAIGHTQTSTCYLGYIRLANQSDGAFGSRDL